ncbi:hypothetical protein K402DRAFT_361709 [Aulographum hederae CBS 113979]|uniref:Uncharacterized protein n=1 Tax=Aulographum hederae CBS 113979 TaxID=1176131 RepID=A0A6G1GQA7_9PEZI|nr:hypothetical protein K402DRAFT_361709 [Aulographum hederae CBS 113979]
MLDAGELNFEDANTSQKIRAVLSTNLDWDFRVKSVNSILDKPATLSAVPEIEHPKIIKTLRLLSRLQAISPSPEVIPSLIQTNIDSAFQVANIPKAAFIKTFNSPNGDTETAELVHANATNIKVRNEMLLLSGIQGIRGTGIKTIDGTRDIGFRHAAYLNGLREQSGTVSMDTLFGDITNMCECDECLSVHSAAAYYVELLQFLRNNNLDPTNPHTNEKVISGTLLERLVQRRPDLGYLKLTCQNTNTVMPYLDLAMEVMESFAAHAPAIDPYNTDDGTTSLELLAEPKHVNLVAYEALSKAVFPPSALPYSLPATTMREFLKALGTSNQELLSSFRPRYQPEAGTNFTALELSELQKLFTVAQDRHGDAEALQMTQGEYVLITQEAFYPKRWFELTQRPAFDGSDVAYRKTIGFSDNAASRFGYNSPEDLLSIDPSTKSGLCFVKNQLLPRLGVSYVDLLSICQTWYLNPLRSTPGSLNEQIVHGIRYSYRFLQSLVDYTETADMTMRYGKLIDFLSPLPSGPLHFPIIRLPGVEFRRRLWLESILSTDDDASINIWDSWKRADWARWVIDWFDRIGKTLVMDSGEGPKLPFSGELVLFTVNDPHQTPGPFNPSGSFQLSARLPPAPSVFPKIQPPAGFSSILTPPSASAELPETTPPENESNIRPAFTMPSLPSPLVHPDLQGPLNGAWYRNAFGTAPLPPLNLTQPLVTPTVIAHVHEDGNIADLNGNIIGYVAFDGRLMDLNGKTFIQLYPPPELSLAVRPLNANYVAVVDENGFLRMIGADMPVVEWSGIKEKCSIDSTILQHLDGTPLTLPEWEKLLVFLRLWKTLGWTVDETDYAIKSDFIDATVTPEIVHRLVQIKQLVDFTSLPVEELLPLWTSLDGQGATAALYGRIFLEYNARNLDDVFMPNSVGASLTQNPPERISAHVPILQAVLGLSSEDIQAIMAFKGLQDKLTVESISVLYRFRTIARILNVRTAQVPDIVTLLGDPFASPENTWELISLWQSITSSGFDLGTLLYLCRNKDDPKNPIAFPEKSAVLAVKQLRDIVSLTNKQHQDVSASSSSVSDSAIGPFLQAELGLLYAAADIEAIDQFLSGTSTYMTNAPKNLDIVVPARLSISFKYYKSKGAIQIIGILSDEDLAALKALGASLTVSAEWSSAFDRIKLQIKSRFDHVMAKFSGFLTRIEAISKLMSADDISKSGETTSTSATTKRRYFLQHFTPYLKTQLVIKAVTAFLSSLLGLTNDVCQFLLSAVDVPGTPSRSVLDAIIALGEDPIPATATPIWSGFLSPPTSGLYTFYAEADTVAPSIVLDRQALAFKRQNDPTNLWISEPVNLSGESLYSFNVPSLAVNGLEWSYGIASKRPIPSDTFIAVDDKQRLVTSVLRSLQKYSILVNKFNFTLEELVYLHTSRPITLSNFSVADWKRLHDYRLLASAVQPRDMSLVELFKWASTNDSSIPVTSAVFSATGWLTTTVDKFVKNLSLQRSDFANAATLARIAKAVKVAEATSVDIDVLFQWAKPHLPGDFHSLNAISDQVQAAFRKRFVRSEWNLAVKPLSDRLRSSRQSALVAYLLAQDGLRGKVTDTDSLFEYFFIDCQMSPLIETSRIKQAISTVQLFVQRCLLGLEDLPNGVSIDRQRWEALMNYRPWEASVKIRLWPENWCEPSIRDDKSPFFRDFESQLMESGLSKDSILDAFKQYLSRVHQISNLIVCGLYVEHSPRTSSQYISNNRIHVFARTRSVPSTFYYRFFNVNDKTWSAWEDMKLDIPVYDDLRDPLAVDLSESIGAYLIPIVHEGRLLVFYPQFSQKTTVEEKTLPASSVVDSPLKRLEPTELLEIKMCWSGYSITSGIGNWSPKTISEKAVHSRSGRPDSLKYKPLSSYRFIPVSSGGTLTIDVLDNLSIQHVGTFNFSDQSFKPNSEPYVFDNSWNQTRYHTLGVYRSPLSHIYLVEMYSFQKQYGFQPFLGTTPYYVRKDFGSSQQSRFYYEGTDHPLSIDQTSSMLGVLGSQSADPIADLIGVMNGPPSDVGLEKFGGKDAHELRSPNSIYFWELGFHAVYHTADQLLKTQQYEDALKMCNKIFDPLASGPQVWRFPPFRQLAQSISSGDFQASFMNLPPGESDVRATEWRNHPFEPHVVARGSPVAYMKMVVMKYVEILISWGDDLFRRNTLETIPSAMQCYIHASHILGPRGQVIPRRGSKAAQTYMSLLNKWDALSNAMVELELAMPTNNSPTTLTDVPERTSAVAPVGASNLFGFATTLYFCVPNNPQFKVMRNTIDGRLFKIRNSQNIDGITRRLPLFEPPIDPALLVQAKANGRSIYSALSDLNTPLSPQRFYLVMQKAIELCQEAVSLSNQMLGIKERRDAESLSLLQAQQERKMRSSIMGVRLKLLDEATATLDVLSQTRTAHVYRLKHQLKLLGIDAKAVPTEGLDFRELDAAIDAPERGAPINCIPEEQRQLGHLRSAQSETEWLGTEEAIVAMMHLLPSITACLQPWGMGATIGMGAEQFSAHLTAANRLTQSRISVLDIKNRGLGLTTGLKRQAWDRFQQANISGYEIKNVDKQVLAQRIRIDIANREIENQQKAIDHAAEIEDYLHSKYTNRELYAWMEGSIRSVHHQAYLFAYDMALKAQKAFRFERPNETAEFISSGYWNSDKDGLLAAQFLLSDLRKLQAASQQKRSSDFEMVKHISLRQWCPLALFGLRETGACEFSFPEVLFDMDFPGHYLRRISSVAVSVPCVVGPYASINATLRLLDHKYRVRADATDYPEKVQENGDDRFATTLLPNNALALTSGINDTGRLDLRAAAETYNPIEGAGIISRWRLELPSAFRQFDYSTISDVVMHMNYTSLNGGDGLKAAASKSVMEHIKDVTDLSRDQGLFAMVDLKCDYATQWYRAFHAPGDTVVVPGSAPTMVNVSLMLDGLKSFLPAFARHASQVVATDIYLLSSDALQASMTVGTTPTSFKPGADVGKLKVAVANGTSTAVTEWTLTFTGVSAGLDKCWLLWRYTIMEM